tara:strand:- start:689 stop:1201 length:513 start_codon:yes stop_codon:yes gene_type:complete
VISLFVNLILITVEELIYQECVLLIMSKSTIVFIIAILVMIVGVYVLISSGELIYLGTNYDDMSTTELRGIATDWNYRDLQRNYDEYVGKVIFIEGTVYYTQKNMNSITICTGTSMSESNCDPMFITTNGNYLEKDEISGFVEFAGVSGVVDSSKEYPDAKDIRLVCSNC